MDIKEQAIKVVKDVEDVIAKKGIGAKYHSQAKDVQVKTNLTLILTGVTLLLGVSIWRGLKN